MRCRLSLRHRALMHSSACPSVWHVGLLTFSVGVNARTCDLWSQSQVGMPVHVMAVRARCREQLKLVKIYWEKFD